MSFENPKPSLADLWRMWGPWVAAEFASLHSLPPYVVRAQHKHKTFLGLIKSFWDGPDSMASCKFANAAYTTPDMGVPVVD